MYQVPLRLAPFQPENSSDSNGLWWFMVLHGGSKEVNNFDNPRFTQNIFQKSHVWLPFLGHWIPKIRRDGFPLYSAIVRWFFRFLGFGVKLFSTFIVKFYHCWLSSATSWLCIELHMTEIDGAPFVRKLLRFVCLVRRWLKSTVQGWHHIF
jgi:hypothetical protein